MKDIYLHFAYDFAFISITEFENTVFDQHLLNYAIMTGFKSVVNFVYRLIINDIFLSITKLHDDA